MLLLIDNPQRAADAAIGLSGMSMANQTYCVQYTLRPDLFRLSDEMHPSALALCNPYNVK